VRVQDKDYIGYIQPMWLYVTNMAGVISICLKVRELVRKGRLKTVSIVVLVR
jgi:hypothetical protein